MTLRAVALGVLLALSPVLARAQSADLRGTLMDRFTRVPVAGARVRLIDVTDTTRVRFATSRDDGSFAFPAIPRGGYQLEATRIGYLRLVQPVRVQRAGQDAGLMLLVPTVLPIGGVAVKGSPPAALQVADTTEFMAKAVRTNPDATAEDLVGKMPGMTVDAKSGTVKTNGEQVQQVLVDGKPFFGTDPTIALRNLPAEVIDRIQVYDKLSDQAELTGFDDGNSTKTMNLILRRDRQRGRFGKAFAGYGDQDRYQAGGSANVFGNGQRVSVIGLANNVNQQNFSAQDLLGVLNTSGPRGGAFGGGPGGGRPGGPRGRPPGGGGGPGGGGFGGPGGGGLSDFLVGQQDGVSTTGSAGTNYSGSWLKRLTVNQNYFYNDADNTNTQDLVRRYTFPLDSVASYGQSAGTENHNRNHRFDSRLEWAADSSNSVIDEPRAYFQSNHASNTTDASNRAADGALVNHATGTGDGGTTGDNLSNHLVLRHRFPKRGRTVSVDVGLAHTLKDGDSRLHSLADYVGSGLTVSDTLDQRTLLHTTTNSISGRAVYTEPLGTNAQLQASYSPGTNQSASDTRAWRLDPLTGAYTIPDSTLTNSFRSTSTSQSAGLGLMVGRTGRRLMVNAAYQHSSLSAGHDAPLAYAVHRTFDDVLPSVTFNQNLANRRNLRLSWMTSTRPPGIGQLQDVVDNSNPLLLTTGNPQLRQSYNHTLLCRFSTTDPVHSRSLFLFASVQTTRDYVANATFTAPRDTVLPGGVTLKQGAQLVSPVNLDGYWNASSFLTYSRPAGFLKSLLNLNTGVTFTRTPGLVNGVGNTASTTALSQGVVLASNISEALDFTVAYTGTYNLTRNSRNVSADADYYSHTASVRLNLIGWRGFAMRHELSNVLTDGVASGYDQDVVLWNASVARKFLAGQRGELRLAATDLLDQNRSTSHSVTETYVQDSRNQTLRQYVMLTFTYSLR